VQIEPCVSWAARTFDARVKTLWKCSSSCARNLITSTAHTSLLSYINLWSVVSHLLCGHT